MPDGLQDGLEAPLQERLRQRGYYKHKVKVTEELCQLIRAAVFKE